jgi:hypothetical protein
MTTTRVVPDEPLNIYDPFSWDRYLRPGLDSTGAEPDAIPFCPFTRAEDNDLALALTAGLTVAEIALDLGRPQWHVDRRIHEVLLNARVRSLIRCGPPPAVAAVPIGGHQR